MNAGCNQFFLVEILSHRVFGSKQSYVIYAAFHELLRSGICNMNNGNTDSLLNDWSNLMHRIGADYDKIRTTPFKVYGNIS